MDKCIACGLIFDESALYECEHCGESVCAACLETHEEDCLDEMSTSWSDAE